MSVYLEVSFAVSICPSVDHVTLTSRRCRQGSCNRSQQVATVVIYSWRCRYNDITNTFNSSKCRSNSWEWLVLYCKGICPVMVITFTILVVPYISNITFTGRSTANSRTGRSDGVAAIVINYWRSWSKKSCCTGNG